MSRKGKNTTIEERNLVIFHHKEKKSYSEIAKVVRLPRSTVATIIHRYKNEDRVASIKQTGRPKKLSERQERILLFEVKKNPKISAPKLKAELNDKLETEISEQTIRRTLHVAGFNGRIARKKPFISKVNKKRRMDFAKTYRNYDATWWNNVIFADESKFNVFKCDGRRERVWRKPNEQLRLINCQATVKHSPSVMVWGCVSSAGVGDLVFIDGKMNKEQYLNILKAHLKQSAVKLGLQNNFQFYQDNDPKHSSRLVQEWMLYNCPKVIKTPAQSPDLNPIEHVWDELDRKIRQRPISSISQLKERLVAEWNAIGKEYLEKTVLNMPKRLLEVHRAQGGPTKY